MLKTYNKQGLKQHYLGTNKPGPEAGSIFPTGLPLPRKRIDPAPRVLTIKKKRTTQGKSARGAQVEDFIPWVRSEPSQPSLLKEEEEEEEMAGFLDRYAARKRKRQEEAKREAELAEGSVLPPMDGGSEIQTIVIPASPEMGSNDQPGSKDIAREELREEAPIPHALQVVHPPERLESRPSVAKLVLKGRKKLFPPNRILLNSYLPLTARLR